MKSHYSPNPFTLPPDNYSWKQDEFAKSREQFEFRKAFKAFIQRRHEVLLYRFKMIDVHFDLQIVDAIYSFLREESMLHMETDTCDLHYVLLNTPSLNFQQMRYQRRRPVWHCWKSYDFPKVSDLWQSLEGKDPLHCLVEPPPKLSTIATPRTPPHPIIFEGDAESTSPPPPGLLQSYFTSVRIPST